jgi:NADH-quinone oxidoreductase subunit L
VIDDGLVNGSARVIGWLASVFRYAQSGYLYHYAFAMILGLATLLLWILWRS